MSRTIKTGHIDPQKGDSKHSHDLNDVSFETSSYSDDEDCKPHQLEDPIKLTTDYLEEQVGNSDINDDTVNDTTDWKSNDKWKTNVIKEFQCRKCKKVYGMYLN